MPSVGNCAIRLCNLTVAKKERVSETPATALLRAQGVVLSELVALPDHFDFSVNPFTAIAADIILITEKDAVKCASIHAISQDERLWVVPVEATLDLSLIENIVEKLRGHSPA